MADDNGRVHGYGILSHTYFVLCFLVLCRSHTCTPRSNKPSYSQRDRRYAEILLLGTRHGSGSTAGLRRLIVMTKQDWRCPSFESEHFRSSCSIVICLRVEQHSPDSNITLHSPSRLSQIDMSCQEDLTTVDLASGVDVGVLERVSAGSGRDENLWSFIDINKRAPRYSTYP